LVILLESWTIFREYVERWPLVELIYSIEEADRDKTRVKIVAGRYGVDLTLARADPLLGQVMEFLEEKSAKRSVEVVQDVETFFSR